MVLLNRKLDKMTTTFEGGELRESTFLLREAKRLKKIDVQHYIEEQSLPLSQDDGEY